MAIKSSNLEQNDAGLWEIGIGLPFSNMAFNRFEKQTTLVQDAIAGSNSFIIDLLDIPLIGKSRIYIGPSSDPTRDINDNQIYFGNFEVFRIVAISLSSETATITIDKLQDGYDNFLQNNYLSGDPIVVRPIAEDWKYMENTDFPSLPSIFSMPPARFSQMKFSREDSLDTYSGYSQGISSVEIIEEPTITSGITQLITGQKTNILQLIKNKICMMSSWVRVQGDKDLGVEPVISCAFYRNQKAEIADVLGGFHYTEGTTQTADDSRNFLLEKKILTPPSSQALRFGVYGNYDFTFDLLDIRLYIDNPVIEHVVGTTQEINGRYTFDINPSIGLSVNNQTSRKTTKDPSGVIRNIKIGDPRLKLNINASWTNRPGFFINDMRKLEQWNRLGYPIVLRTKMPGSIPNVLFVDMNVKVDYTRSAGNQRADVDIEFKEIAV